jgi:hypothetical protein
MNSATALMTSHTTAINHAATLKVCPGQVVFTLLPAANDARAVGASNAANIPDGVGISNISTADKGSALLASGSVQLDQVYFGPADWNKFQGQPTRADVVAQVSYSSDQFSSEFNPVQLSSSVQFSSVQFSSVQLNAATMATNGRKLTMDLVTIVQVKQMGLEAVRNGRSQCEP